MILAVSFRYFSLMTVNLHIHQDSNRVLHHFSADKHPSLYRALPTIEDLQSAWEAKLDNPQFEIYHDAVRDGLVKLMKYYCRFDEKPAYIIALSMYHFISSYSKLTLTRHSTSSILQASLHQTRVGRSRGTGCRVCERKTKCQELAGRSVEGHRECREFSVRSLYFPLTLKCDITLDGRILENAPTTPGPARLFHHATISDRFRLLSRFICI
jgi:hypothetical protein